MTANSKPANGYGSADDLPSVVEMREQLAGMRQLAWLMTKEQQAELDELDANLTETTQLVDDFYALLGPRHWVYPDNVSMTDIKALVQLEAAEAEQALIALYSPKALRFLILQLNRHEGSRVRLELVRKALDDYEAGRYYATVLVLLTVMDGFVNDVDKAQRKGLHARSTDEMVAWDSVTGHHQGLARTHEMFTKGTYKTTTDELHELQRHGILHGMQLNYDNIVVATKAWNQLFAVADWATSLERQATSKPPEPTWDDIFKQVAKTEAVKTALNEWQPYVLNSGDKSFDQDPTIVAARSLLDAWQRKNYGEAAALLAANVRRDTPGKTAGMVSREYQSCPLDDYEITALDRYAAAAANVDVLLTVNGETKPGQLFWLREDADGAITVLPNQGVWRLVNWGPLAMYGRAAGNKNAQ